QMQPLARRAGARHHVHGVLKVHAAAEAVLYDFLFVLRRGEHQLAAIGVSYVGLYARMEMLVEEARFLEDRFGSRLILRNQERVEIGRGGRFPELIRLSDGRRALLPPFQDIAVNVADFLDLRGGALDEHALKRLRERVERHYLPGLLGLNLELLVGVEQKVAGIELAQRRETNLGELARRRQPPRSSHSDAPDRKGRRGLQLSLVLQLRHALEHHRRNDCSCNADGNTESGSLCNN